MKKIVLSIALAIAAITASAKPAHTHDRRVECYFYFNVPEGNAICHLMGEPQENRLIWLNNEQAVMSPEWSIHAAAGTSNYMFIWAWEARTSITEIWTRLLTLN